jgi:thiamine biosynthesis lipoprotein
MYWINTVIRPGGAPQREGGEGPRPEGPRAEGPRPEGAGGEGRGPGGPGGGGRGMAGPPTPSAAYTAVVEVLPLTFNGSKGSAAADPDRRRFAVREDGADNRVLIPPMSAPPSTPAQRHRLVSRRRDHGHHLVGPVVAPPGVDKEARRRRHPQELAAVVAVFSPWETTSEISRFNGAPAGTWALSQLFWSLLEAAMDIADDTNGAVDPTLGALVDLWGFGPPGPRPTDTPLPSDEEIDAAKAVSGWQKLRLNTRRPRGGPAGGMKLDFSGIAKGHAVDRVSGRLTAMGATSHLIEIGGELRGAGVKPDGQPWWVEIEQPPGSPAPRTLIALIDIAMATSGDYRRAFSHEGRRYSHTVDGRTGRPIDNGLASVTVVHPSAMKADAFATALTVMGPMTVPSSPRPMDWPPTSSSARRAGRSSGCPRSTPPCSKTSRRTGSLR